MVQLGAATQLTGVYLPLVKNEKKISGAGAADVKILAHMILWADWQQRPVVYENSLLSQAAQKKADEMSRKNYFGHTSPEGVTANENVRSVGYRLPDFYPLKGNHVESLYIGHDEPELAVEGWLGSPSHREHLTGSNDFYRGHTAIGIGTAVAQDGRQIWVFLSAPGTR